MTLQEKFQKDAALKAKAQKCTSKDDLQKLAKSEGFDISGQELEDAYKFVCGGELDEDDLENVAGGKGESSSPAAPAPAPTPEPAPAPQIVYKEVPVYVSAPESPAPAAPAPAPAAPTPTPEPSGGGRRK